MSQPHANVECKWRKRVGGRGEGSLDSAPSTKQINKARGHSPARVSLAIPSPPKPLLGDTRFGRHGLEMFHSTHVRKLSTPVQPPNHVQHPTKCHRLVRRRQQEGCRLERKLPSHRRSRVRRGVIHPPVRPSATFAAENTAFPPSLLPSFPVNSFSLSSSL